jgi:hypothetical protein
MTTTRNEWIDRYLAKARELCPDLPDGWEAQEKVSAEIHTERVAKFMRCGPDNPEDMAIQMREYSAGRGSLAFQFIRLFNWEDLDDYEARNSAWMVSQILPLLVVWRIRTHLIVPRSFAAG